MSKLAETLVAARQRLGERLDEVEQATRIRYAYLDALENDDFRRLPPLVYTRGFVRNYAVYLRLNPQEMVRLYDEAIGYQPEQVHLETNSDVSSGRLIAPNVAAIGVALALAGILFVWLYSAFFVVGPASSARMPTPIVPTPTAITAASLLTPTPTPLPPTPTTVPATAVAVGAMTTPSASTPVVVTSEATPEATSTPKPTPRTDGLALHIQIMEKPSWLQIRTDGVVVFSGTLAPGAERTFDAKQEIFIHSGRADSVALELNGVSQGRLGEPGQTVVRKTFTADNLAN